MFRNNSNRLHKGMEGFETMYVVLKKLKIATTSTISHGSMYIALDCKREMGEFENNNDVCSAKE